MSNPELASAVRDAARVNLADLTVDSLRQHRPDLVAAIEAAVDVKPQVAAARADGEKAGATAERERLAGIDKIMPVGMEKLRDELKADPTMTAEKAAVRFLEAGNAATAARLQGLKDADVKVPAAPNAGSPAGDPKAEGEEAWKAEFAKGDTGFSTEADYIAFKKADARGGVKILQGKAA